MIFRILTRVAILCVYTNFTQFQIFGAIYSYECQYFADKTGTCPRVPPPKGENGTCSIGDGLLQGGYGFISNRHKSLNISLPQK